MVKSRIIVFLIKTKNKINITGINMSKFQFLTKYSTCKYLVRLCMCIHTFPSYLQDFNQSGINYSVYVWILD